MITIFLIFAACLFMNILMIFYSQKQLKRQPAFRLRVQPTDEEVLDAFSELAQLYFEEQRKEKVNWHNEGF